jgi:VIT1/CCC1 family predicted Fe2+/Mn2+ transporter
MHRIPHLERHNTGRVAWLRASVLGANDALVSVTSLMLGVAASDAAGPSVLVAGVAGVVAGALSMAAGEYVSVSSQRDAERAEIAREKRELSAEPIGELRELAAIYEQRGLDPALALQVATQLSEHDRLGAHVRDELGIIDETRARPLLAAASSALGFALFGCLPIGSLMLAPAALRIPIMGCASAISLAALGASAAQLGGAPVGRAALRVTLGGVLAMAVTALVGRLFGVVMN